MLKRALGPVMMRDGGVAVWVCRVGEVTEKLWLCEITMREVLLISHSP